jgi:hypothetical protein
MGANHVVEALPFLTRLWIDESPPCNHNCSCAKLHNQIHRSKENILMEATFETSVPTVRNKIALIEAIELFSIGAGLWLLTTLVSRSTPEKSIVDLLVYFIIFQVIFLGSWAIYNVYIRIARAGGRTVDIGIWILASLATGTYTFWAWLILDVNRFIMAKLFYRGEAPVEYAWSWRSKQIRKLWEQARKTSN